MDLNAQFGQAVQQCTSKCDVRYNDDNISPVFSFLVHNPKSGK
jgi:hypothetical protein